MELLIAIGIVGGYALGWLLTARLIFAMHSKMFPTLAPDYLSPALFAIVWPGMLVLIGLEALLKLTYRGIE